jgi:vacuolar-type H+-ATPase subunit H
LELSEERLLHVSELKKMEVSEQIVKIIDYIKQLEEEFHNEIDEFKNNRLSILQSAPPEFKETNANLIQFVNQSLEDMMRPDIKEEDVKEINNRCEEHRRLWNETEIIFNSNYAIGEVIHLFYFYSFEKNNNNDKMFYYLKDTFPKE